MLLLLFLFFSLCWFSSSGLWERTKVVRWPEQKTSLNTSIDVNKKLLEKSTQLKPFLKKKTYNQDICFFIDMSLASGQNRFFIYDLNKDSILNSGLVAHGNCFEYWLEGRRYSNVTGSGCTSLGRYRIGAPYIGRFGFSYKLHGLDSSNSNAFERTVVLHSHSCVPENGTKDEICQSNGCPMVAPPFLAKLKKIITESKKPVLLWIYE
ncbi:MAG TPA: murein L,D-transpeptidase catalytic domain family protein [Chitinophagaceae bacterium]|nr:murein L,D-transpeptidase catalytic domain family protein [Chitinophagaceae bacterium]